MEKQERKRLFIGKLFEGVKDDDLIKRFSPFGRVINVDLKVKHSGEASITFAFIDVEINQQNLAKCIKTFNGARWNGSEMKVEVAKESFLQRLKAERENSLRQTRSEPKPRVDSKGLEKNGCRNGSYMKEKKATSKKPPCDTHGGSFLGDLEKFSEIWKDVNTCVPVVTSRSDDSKPSKRQISESKRYLSVEKKIEIATAQQKCIENSLRNTNSRVNSNKKIKFDSDDENSPGDASVIHETESSPLETSEKDRPRLFDSDCEEDNVEDLDKTFRVRPEFEGEAGQKLANLKRRYGNDDRFKLDERFIDEEKYNVQNETSKEEEEDVSLTKEKERNFEVLESVLGYQLPKQNPKERKFNEDRARIKQLRYDPTGSDAQQLEIHKPQFSSKDDEMAQKREFSKAKKSKKASREALQEDSVPETSKDEISSQKRELSKAKKSKKASRKAREEVSVPEASKERFYLISESLKDVLKLNEKGKNDASFSFSFVAPEEKAEKDYDGVKTINVPPQSTWDRNPFTYDTSDDDDDSEELPLSSEVPADEKHKLSDAELDSQLNQTSITKDSFFVFPGDSRLTDGVEFFRRQDDIDTITERWTKNKPYVIASFKEFKKRTLRTPSTKRGRNKKFLRKKVTKQINGKRKTKM